MTAKEELWRQRTKFMVWKRLLWFSALRYSSEIELLLTTWKTFKIMHSKSLENFYEYGIVKDIMKNNLHLSFKRWKPRPNTINMQKLKLWRLLFCIKFIRSLDSEILIASVDESKISRHSQLFYSWSQKGQPQEFKKYFVYRINRPDINYSE